MQVQVKQLLAFIAVVVASLFGVLHFANQTTHHATHTLYQSQLASCARENELRSAIDQPIAAQQTQNQALMTFAQTASDARYANYKSTHLHSDLIAARTYASIAHRLANLQFKALPLVNCYKAIPRP